MIGPLSLWVCAISRTARPPAKRDRLPATLTLFDSVPLDQGVGGIEGMRSPFEANAVLQTVHPVLLFTPLERDYIHSIVTPIL